MKLLERYTAPLLARIPDVSEVPTNRLIVIGVVISLLLHLIAFLLLALFYPNNKTDLTGAPLKPREIEIQVVPPVEPPPPAFTIRPTQQRLFMDSTGLDISKDPAEHPIFEADENMKAASEMPATGDLPLPGQEGRESPFNEFATQRSLLGPIAQPFSANIPAVPPSPPPAPVVPPSPPTPTTPQVAQQTTSIQKPDNQPPGPTPFKTEKKPPTKDQDQTKPNELRAVEKVEENEIALKKSVSVPEAITEILKPVATPPPVSHAALLRSMDGAVNKPITTPPPQVQPQPTPPPQMAMLTTPPPPPQPPQPQPRPRVQPSYQPEQEKNRIESSINNRGRGAVDAVGTPMGRWRKQVHDAIGSRWLYYVRNKGDVLGFGTVKVNFTIDTQGHVSHLQVTGNSANQSLESVTIQAIRDSEIMPPPLDPNSPIGQEPLEWSIDFTYYTIQ